MRKFINKSGLFLSILFLTGYSLNLNAQEYQYTPIPTTNAAWNVFYRPPASYTLYDKVYATAGDTLIYNETWTKITLVSRELVSDYLGNIISDSISETIYQGAYLETDKVVRFCSSDEKIDTLYDFNLEVGDTVKFLHFEGVENSYMWIEDTCLIVKQIDSILIQNYYRKCITFKPIFTGDMRGLQEKWIEGIGSIHGVLFPLNLRTFVDEAFEKEDLTCFWVNNDLLWQNGWYNSCKILKTNEFAKINSFEIYPNPAHGQITISNTDYTINNVSISDIMGKRVFSKHDYRDVQAEVDIQFLSKGIYTVQIITQTGEILTGKFIKQ